MKTMSMKAFGNLTSKPKVQDRALRVKTKASKVAGKTTQLRKLRKSN